MCALQVASEQDLSVMLWPTTGQGGVLQAGSSCCNKVQACSFSCQELQGHEFNSCRFMTVNIESCVLTMSVAALYVYAAFIAGV